MTTDAQKQTSEKTLNQLITTKTFQGLTDDEINTIIDYRVQQGITRAKNEEQAAENKRMEQVRIEEVRASSTKAQNVLESLLNRKLVLRSVEVCNE